MDSSSSLAAVDCVALRAVPSLATLPHVTDLLTAFVDPAPLYSPAQAIASGSFRLFERVLSRFEAPTDRAWRSFWCARALEHAIQRNDLGLVHKIHALHPGPLGVRSLTLAFQYGTLETVQWIASHRSDRLCCSSGIHNLCSACVAGAMSKIGKHDTFRVVMWCHSQGLFDPSVADLKSVLPAVLNTMQQCPELVEWYDSLGLLKNLSATALINYTSTDFDVVPLLLAILERPTSFREDTRLVALQGLAMQPGQEDLVERLLTDTKYRHVADKVTFQAVREGGKRVLQWEIAFVTGTRVDYVPMVRMIAQMARLHGHIDTMEWLSSKCGVQTFGPPAWSVGSNTQPLEVLTWLHATGRADWSMLPLNGFAKLGSLAAVEWFHTHRPDDFTSRTMDVAAGAGRLEIIQWLHKNRSEGCTHQAIESAAFAGHLEVVQWLHENRPEGNTNFAVANAVLGGHLDVVIWLCEHRIDTCVACVVQFVLSYGHTMMGDTSLIHTLEWLDTHATRRDGCQVTALSIGDVALLAYLFEHHPYCVASWRDQHARIARIMVEHGHVGCVQWMYQHHRDECDWDVVQQRAATQRSNAIMDWFQATR